MKPITPHDPLDDMIAAALHGELTPGERTQFETRLSNDPAARAAYQEAQLMHTMLENTYADAQPDAAFEQRMVSGVRRRLQNQQPAHESAWQSVLVLWNGLKKIFGGRSLWAYGGVCSAFMVVALCFVVITGNQVKGVFTTISSQLAYAGNSGEPAQNFTGTPASPAMADAEEQLPQEKQIEDAQQKQFNFSRTLINVPPAPPAFRAPIPIPGATSSGEKIFGIPSDATGNGNYKVLEDAQNGQSANGSDAISHQMTQQAMQQAQSQHAVVADDKQKAQVMTDMTKQSSIFDLRVTAGATASQATTDNTASAWSYNYGTATGTPPPVPAAKPANGTDGTPATTPATPPPAIDTRKLIRNADLELEVKSFPTAMDEISAMTKAAGGYVDTSNSQKGGNGKLQGIVVVKVLPQYLDDYLLKLRDVGEVRNQSVKTDDVTKDYFDTQARLDNSRRMETQLQDLLKHENSKVSDLLQVERELGRVRGDIEQMQGQIKLYDFQVAYATVTIQLREKDLNQTAAYLLKEEDNFSLFATDVEATFQKARAAADDFKAQVLVANLVHNSGSDVSAELVVMVAPEQIEPFLAQVRGLGRVSNFTRQTQRVAKDGGDSDQPADQALTEKDKVQVHVSIRSDDETRKQVALTVVATAVDTALDAAKTAALSNAGAEILSSSLNKTPQGQSTAQLSVRIPGKEYSALIDAFGKLGRTASLSIQRNDNSGPGANGDDAPVIVSLSLTDNDTPVQETSMSVLASDVDGQAQQIKKDAATAGIEVKSSNFERQPDGTEAAQMTFGLPMSKYAAFVESLKKLGKVESLTVRRQDRPDQTRTDETAPVEIGLLLHNQRAVIADDHGLWATLRQTFGEGANALFGSIKTIGVIIAFLAPWVVTIAVLAWIGRRIYLWRRK